MKRTNAGKMRAAHLFLTIALISSPGCTSPLGWSGDPVIWGKVAHNGAAVKNAYIVFSPIDGGPNVSDGIGHLGSTGAYRISTDQKGQPLITGWYRISILPKAVPNGQPAAAYAQLPPSPSTQPRRNREDDKPESNRLDEQAPAAAEDASAESKDDAVQVSPNEYSNIPAKYSNPETSNLKMWIRAQPTNVDITLKD